MRSQFDEILTNITKAVDDYHDLPQIDMDAKDLSNILKRLQSNMYYLAQYRIDFHKQWHHEYFTCNESSDAARTKHADRTVKEIYTCRQIMKVVDSIMNGIRSQISIYKKEQ